MGRIRVARSSVFGFQGRKIVADPLYLLPTSQAQA